MSKGLKECPFCGSMPIIRYVQERPLIECGNSKCHTQPSTWFYVKTDSFKKLVYAWNKRKGDE